MPQSFDDLLDHIRSSSRSSRDLGSAFEKLVSDFLVTDSTQKSRFCQVSSYADWARKQGLPADDAGIDLVATTKAGDTVAIQAKCYAAHRVIHKKDIDSFISASAKSHFAGRLIADTTEGSWSPQADEMLRDQNLKVTRLSLKEFRNSDVDWGSVGSGKPTNVKKFSPFKHQDEATEKVSTALATQDCGYMVMACGSGKTFTALQITEKMLSHKGLVLYVVPSLSLMNQSLQKWHQQAQHPIRSFAVCSDSRVGRREARKGDTPYTEPFDMVIPPTTDAGSLMKGFHDSSHHDDDFELTVIFSTYQSLATITEAQKLGLGEFDLVICDEAHRTTGVTHEGEDPSHFVKVHDDQYIKAKKRLYMTATPRIYSDSVKADASEEHVTLASMDDESVYGKLLYYYSFDQAVRDNRLTDYKVIILGVRQDEVSRLSLLFSEDSSEIVLDDATKIIGAYKGLRGDWNEGKEDPIQMKRVLAFAKDIKSSKLVKTEFSSVIEKYLAGDPEATSFEVTVDHVDGTYDTKKRSELISWLENVSDDDGDKGASHCHMLSNARCLSEGVDIPALDGVIFFHPRKSVVDVVQSVGRVMRKAPGKQMGYVILPVCLPEECSSSALDNHPNFKVIWQVLSALRSHDERLEAAINQQSLGQDVSDRIAIHLGPITSSPSFQAVTDKVDVLPVPSSSSSSSHLGIGEGLSDRVALQGQMQHQEAHPWMDVVHKAITAQMVKNCGTREYWSDWAESAAKIASSHITRIKGLIHKDDHPGNRKVFDTFLSEIRDDLNDSITESDAIEMLAQHLITRPIFESLFSGREFVDKNPVSQAMSKVMYLMDQNNVHRESRELDQFYHRIKVRSEGLTDPKAKQQLITELYEKFFAKAFPRTVEMLGIAYTPVEIVDFMIRSVSEILKEEFDLTLGSEGVHILDPFVGTGTFITRLFQSGLMEPAELERKYLGTQDGPEIHANEILLLAYYIAAINIETAYEGVMSNHQSKSYEPFRGICLTDTFGLHEKDDQTAELFEVNSQRRMNQKAQKVKVILGNPPYSVGQKSANDNAANTSYERLDSRTRDTYVESSLASNKNSLYNSYIRAFRLASDLIEEASGGVLAFITDAGWVESVAASGLRYHLVRDFSKIYVFHLRGNARTTGETWRREGGKIFGQSSRCPVAVNFFIRHQNHASQAGPAEIHYYDIGDYLKREAKLTKIERLGSIAGITALKDQGWQKLVPDGYHDWLNQRDPGFSQLIALGDKKKREDKKVFENYSKGICTARDAWCYNPCRSGLLTNMKGMIGFYNQEVERLHKEFEEPSLAQTKKHVDRNQTKIKWADELYKGASRRDRFSFHQNSVVVSSYRPFVKKWLYVARCLNERVYQIPQIFPLDPQQPSGTCPNVVIGVMGVGETADWSVLITDCVPNLHFISSGQCFPRYLYDPDTLERREAITDQALAHFQVSYLGGDSITKEQIFFYIYGILQSEDYRNRFDANLKKELARIPVVTSLADFKAFSKGGKALTDLHLDYEKDAASLRSYACHELGVRVVEKEKSCEKKASDPVSYYRVKKMKWSDRDKELSQITYNPFITIENIPSEVMAFEVSGRPALQWVVDYQKVKVDKASGITKDPNAYGSEQDHPEYLLDLVLAVIAVSVKTQRLIETLPKLTIKSHTDAVCSSSDLSRVS